MPYAEEGKTMKRIASRLALVLCAVILLGTAVPARAQTNRYSGTFYDAFDTITQLIGFTESEERFRTVFEETKREMLRYHRIFDGYNAYDGVYNLYYVNANAASGPVKAEPELIELLLWTKERQAQLGGRVNIAMGAVLSVWHEYREEGKELPPDLRLREAAKHGNIEDVVIDAEQGTVFFADPELKLDLGAVAKGYAVEKVASGLLEKEMPSFIISAGGNVRCGEKPLDGRERWGIGITDPDGSDEYRDVLYLTGQSIVTSGDYQRWYEVDGVRYHHIIDPDTLMPSAYMRAVTVVTPDSGYADILSTALFLMPCEDGLALVDSLENVEAFWIRNDGTQMYSAGLRQALRSEGASARD